MKDPESAPAQRLSRRLTPIYFGDGEASDYTLRALFSVEKRKVPIFCSRLPGFTEKRTFGINPICIQVRQS